MFSDYNGYFKGGRTGAWKTAAVGRSCTGINAPPRRGGSPRAKGGGLRARRTDERSHQKNNTSAGDSLPPPRMTQCEKPFRGLGLHPFDHRLAEARARNLSRTRHEARE